MGKREEKILMYINKKPLPFRIKLLFFLLFLIFSFTIYGALHQYHQKKKARIVFESFLKSMEADVDGAVVDCKQYKKFIKEMKHTKQKAKNDGQTGNS